MTDDKCTHPNVPSHPKGGETCEVCGAYFPHYIFMQYDYGEPRNVEP